MNGVSSGHFKPVIFIEPEGYDLDQLGIITSDNSLPMLNYNDGIVLERWFDGPVQMSLRAGLITLISFIHFYAAKGLRSIDIDFDNQPLSWMNQIKTKEGKTFLDTCIRILQDQKQIEFTPPKTIRIREAVKLL